MMKPVVALLFSMLVSGAVFSAPLGSTITYQGELEFGGAPASGNYDFEFTVFDDPSAGVQLGSVVALEDVVVIDGLFSTELDFGAGVFSGSQLWLEIAVREGASTGAFQTLLPRQKMTATPYALHAEMVAADAIAGAEIVDGSIMGVDLATGAVGSSEIADGSIGSADIDDGQVQRRVLGACAPGTQISAIDPDGSVQCEGGVSYENIIAVAKSGGDFTSVTAAMNAIGSDPDYPPATDVNRYLVWVAPGIYDNEDVDMQSWVDIQGSGQGITVLHSEGGTGGISPDSATLVGADNAELRDLTVEIDAADSGFWTHAIYTAAGTRLSNVTANARGGAHPRALMVANGGSPVLIDVILSATQGALVNIALDVVQSTVVADGLFAVAEGGVEAKGMFINTASSEVVLENVSVRVGGSTSRAYGVEAVVSDATIEGLRVNVDSEAQFNRGVLCRVGGFKMRLVDAVVNVRGNAAPGGSQSTDGVLGIHCDFEIYGLVIDALSSQETRAVGLVHSNSISGAQSSIVAKNVDARVRSVAGTATGVQITSSTSAGDTSGRLDNVSVFVEGGTSGANSYGILENADGDVLHRGLSIDVRGQGDFVYGIQSSGQGARFEDVSLDVAADAAVTTFGVELFGDQSSVSSARVRVVNTGSGSGHDAVGIKSNGATDVAITSVAAYAEAETNVWGLDMVNSGTRVDRVTTEAVGNPGNVLHGARCLGGDAEVSDSDFRTGATGSVGYGIRSDDCSSEIFDSNMAGESYGAYLSSSSADTTIIRDSYLAGVTTILTAGDAVATIIAGMLDGGAGIEAGTSSQECTAVIFNSGGSETFQAGTSSPCP